jgi:hypothetical protein
VDPEIGVAPLWPARGDQSAAIVPTQSPVDDLTFDVTEGSFLVLSFFSAQPLSVSEAIRAVELAWDAQARRGASLWELTPPALAGVEARMANYVEVKRP